MGEMELGDLALWAKEAGELGMGEGRKEREASTYKYPCGKGEGMGRGGVKGRGGEAN